MFMTSTDDLKIGYDYLGEETSTTWTGVMLRRILAMPGTFGIAARLSRPWTVSGFALLRIAADECELLSLAVAPEHRGHGVGAMLLQGAMEQARRSGAAKFFLEVAEDNVVARNLYHRHGLAPVGRRPDYYRRKDGTSAAAVTMSCGLDAIGVQVRA